MAFDISKFARPNFNLETDSLGTIQCGSLTVGMFSKIQKELKVDNIDSIVFTRKLLHEVGQHTNKGLRQEDRKDKDEIESVPLGDVDINCLADEEIETFAREFIAHNDWLLNTFEAAQHSVTTGEKGENFVSIQPIPIDLPKEDTERDSDYLVRVLCRYLDEQADRTKRMWRPFSGSLFRNTFSNATEDLLKKHVSLSDQLGETLRGLAPELRPHLDSIIEPRYMDIEVPTLPEDPGHETNRRLGDVLDHAEELRPIILQSAELFRSMSDTALQMQVDFNRSARQSLFVSFLVACIATSSLVVTAVYSWWSYENISVKDTQYQHNFREQQAQIHTLVQQQDDRYWQLVGNQDEKFEALVTRHDAQIKRIIESLLAANANQSESDRQLLIEALLKACNLWRTIQIE